MNIFYCIHSNIIAIYFRQLFIFHPMFKYSVPKLIVKSHKYTEIRDGNKERLYRRLISSADSSQIANKIFNKRN